jgi:hypothetical protein
MLTDLDPAINAYWIANDMEKKRYEYDLKPNDVVVDLGAYTGSFAETIHSKYGCQVICVEPTNAANHLSACPWATVVNAAASVDNIPMKFGGAFYYTSLFVEGEGETYPCFDVLELIIDQEIALLKCNTEGCEYLLLDRILDADLMKNIKYLQVQFHKLNETSQYKRAAIQQRLLKTHEQMWNVDFCWESWHRKGK